MGRHALVGGLDIGPATGLEDEPLVGAEIEGTVAVAETAAAGTSSRFRFFLGVKITSSI